MRTHTIPFKEQLKTLGRQIKATISYGNTTLEQELYSVTPHYEANIFKSVMKQLDIESSVDIPIDTVINCKIGLYVPNDTLYRWMDFGNYVVCKSEKQEDSNHYIITCYDKMVYAMKPYEDLGITYPITITNYINAIATKIGLSTSMFLITNGNKQIQEELYLGLDYTYRDVLDEIAEATGTIIYINNSDKLAYKKLSRSAYPDVIDEEFLKDVNVKFGEMYGPINSVVLSRSGESDNVYLRDETSVTQNGLCEVKIVDNQILNGNDRSEYLTGILGNVNGLTYSINDFNTVGILYYELGDSFDVQIGETTYPCFVLNDEINVTSGLTETIYTKMPEQSETDYTKAGKDDKKISLVVDKQNKKIEAVAENSATKAELELTAAQLRSIISASIGTTNAINNSDFSAIDNNGNYNYLHWTLADTANYEVVKINDKTWLQIYKDNLGSFYLEQEFRNIDANENYTLSFKLKNNAIAVGDERNDRISLVIYFYDSSNNIISTMSHAFSIEDILTEQNYEHTFTTPNQTIAYARLRIQFSNYYDSNFENSVTFNANITNLQLELGTVKTDWMPSQSDFYEKVQQYSQIVQRINEIELEVSETYETKNNAQTNYSRLTARTDSLSLEVGGKLDEENFTGANIMLAINDDNSSATINADKISLARKTNRYDIR